ncbi:MAG: argininosuccinate lyase [Candidatus Micrarchaeota archaeon]
MIWGGRFSKDTRKNLLLFNSADNILIDEKLVEYDIIGSIAHVKMLTKQKLIKQEESEAILTALNEVLSEWKAGTFKLDPTLEDVHMNVEVAVTKKTPHGKKIHTARSRNDQVNLDMRLYMRDRVKELKMAAQKLQEAFTAFGKGNITIPAHTHTRVAQPISSKFYSDAYVISFGKDIERLEQFYKRINKSPLGACAISGTTLPIDKNYTAKLLGFDGVEENPLEIISSRGELEAELVFICSILATKLSRIAEDMIWFSYVGLIELPEDYCTGSSIMPNKMNPDVFELIRGRTGKINGNLVNLLTIMKGTPTGHNADTQETKKAVIDSVETILASILISAEIMPKIKWNKKKADELIKTNYAAATLLADDLVKKGMPFREAHEKIGKLIKKLEKEERYIEN